ncbi:histidine phosphatase family protein [Alkalihalobacillus sp. 1P02AB]|uniref:histidine phosphatase family protein n=1 Tax=Alkalihalobacillus sp. 1P02AB TaxID=3132260 RepID=UPI0039A44DB8
MNLYLIRHGQSEGNRLKKIQGTMDFPLSEDGKRQVELLGERFVSIKLDHLYSSDLTRASSTADAIAVRKNMTVHKWDKLREVELGPLQGKTRVQIYEEFPQANKESLITSGIDGTETVEQLEARCKYILEQLLLAHKGKNIALVSHGGFLSVLMMYILTGEQWVNFHRPFRFGNTSITHLEWPLDSEKPYLHYMNDRQHLNEQNQAMTDRKIDIL